MICFTLGLTAQSRKVSFYVDHQKNCAEALDDFRKKNELIIAFNEDLQHIKTIQSRKLDADNIQDLFSKLCQVYSLDFIIHDHKTYLVRSSAVELRNAENSNIHLNIKDEVTGDPVAFATVYDQSGKVFGFTDAYGDCFFKHRKSKDDLKLFVHSLSYKDHEIRVSQNLDFVPVKLQLDPVKVIPISIKTLKNKLYFARTQSIDIDQRGLDQLSGASVFSNDVIRNVQILPGVAATNDAKASLRVRGSHEEATLMVLDEMPIYRADHFYGVFGAFNGDYIDQFSLFRNNIPVQYGGRTSGMLRMESLNQIDSSFFKLDANLLNLGIHTAIPLSKSLAVNFAYRKSLSNLTNTGFNDLSERENLVNKPQEIMNQNLARSNPDFDFFDMNGNVLYRMGSHRLKANVFLSNDVFNNSYITNFLGKDKAKIRESFSQENQWSNQAGGLHYIYETTESKTEVNAYITSHSNNYDILSQLTKRYPNVIDRDTFAIQNDNLIRDYGGKVKMQIPKWWNTFAGLEYIHHTNSLTLANESATIFESNRVGREAAVFAGLKWDKNPSWSMEPAMRMSYIPELNQAYFLPQIYATVMISNTAKIKAAASKHVQYIRQIEHENILGQKQSYFVLANDKNIPIGIGQNYMIGTWMGWGRIGLDVEAYFRKLDGTTIHATTMPGLRIENRPLQASEFKIFSGETYTKGVDISLTYNQKNYSGIFSYTLSKTDNRFSEIFQNQWFPASEDSRHQLKWAQYYTIRKWEISTQFVGATGRPFLDLTGLNARVLRENLAIDQFVSSLPAYYRWDIGLAYQTKFLSQNLRLGFSVFNVLDRNNVKFRQFVHQLPPAPGTSNPKQTLLGNDVEQLGRTFNISIVLDIR